MRGVDWTSKAGLDNPDNNYFFALLDDEGTYRLTVSAATPRNSSSSSSSVCRGGNAGSSTNVSVLYADQMEMDDEGKFEIIVSPERPEGVTNWMKNAPGAESLLVVSPTRTGKKSVSIRFTSSASIQKRLRQHRCPSSI